MRTQKNHTWECIKGEKGVYYGVAFEYQGCGIIEPIIYTQGSIRRSCACERAARQLKEQQDREEERRKWKAEQIQNTYRWLGHSWGNIALAQKTFANFQQQYQLDAYQIVCAYARYPTGNLILHGTYGTGKTHLLSAICNDLRERENNPLTSRFLTSLDLFNSIQGCINNHQSYEWILKKAASTPLLVIDDLDKAKRSDFREEIYFCIIDKRVQNELPIALSTNRLAELPDFVGQACFSRLRVGLIEIEMIGEDYRGKL